LVNGFLDFGFFGKDILLLINGGGTPHLLVKTFRRRLGRFSPRFLWDCL
jgi:hypothetical protein